MARSQTSSRARKIFERALDLGSGEARALFVQEACGGDSALLNRVRVLLAANEAADSFLPDQPNAAASATTTTEQPGAVIGRYKLLEKIGEGGMGVVYMAEQEEPVRRKVALKVIKLGMDTKQVVARFEAERQALAMMDHPNIAKVLDGGATETGRPYFVMELVQGVPITEFCETNRLPPGERLKLFIPVCQAIQSAHQKGIIHRDIKPSNVLVTLHDGVPVPKVIDFGVAKATNQTLTEKTLFTNYATMIGTPAYMSPEQAEMSGLDIDTRSDIYGLGVLLYELLTGTTPFSEKRLRSVAYSEMQRIIVEEEPERPSTRLRRTSLAGSPSQFITRHSSLSTDLDWIVMKCLEKDRNRRYETANGVAADLQRHLDNEAIVARPPSTAYRFQKLVRRNQLAFAAAAALGLALLAGIAVSSWQAARARRAERTARQQAEVATAVKDFLAGQLLNRANPFVDAAFDPNRRAVLESVARQLEGRFTDQPRIEAEIRLALADAFDGWDDHENVLIHAQRAYELFRRLLGPVHSDTLRATALFASARENLGRMDGGEKLLNDAIAAARRVPGLSSQGFGELLSCKVYRLEVQGKSAEALPLANEALAMLQRTVDAKDVRIVDAKFMVANATAGIGRNEEAERLWKEGVKHCEWALGGDHPRTAMFLRGQGLFYQNLGRLDEAVDLLEHAVAIQRRTLTLDHLWAVNDEVLLARVYIVTGKKDRAIEIYREVPRRLRKPLSTASARRLAIEAGQFLADQGIYPEAKAAFVLVRDHFATHPVDQVSDFPSLLIATAGSEGWPAAARLCHQHLDQFPDSLWVWLNKAWVLQYAGDEQGYHEVLRKVLASANSIENLENQRLAVEVAALAPCAFSEEEQLRIDSLMHALEASLPAASSNERAWGYRAIGQLQLRRSHFQKALAALDEASRYGSREELGHILLVKAICLRKLGRKTDAEAAFAEAAPIMQKLLPAAPVDAENFLPTNKLYSTLLWREAQAAMSNQ